MNVDDCNRWDSSSIVAAAYDLFFGPEEHAFFADPTIDQAGIWMLRGYTGPQGSAPTAAFVFSARRP
jgi:hypothetical protein